MENFVATSNTILNELKKPDNQIIYHYTGLEGFQAIIDSGKLRFTDIFCLNDFSERLYTLDLVIDNIGNLFDLTLFSEEEIRKCCDEFKNRFKKNNPFAVYQMSFSLNGDSLPLWNYYTKGAGIQGMNLKFQSDELVKGIVHSIWDDSVETHPYILGGCVVYDKEQQLKIIKKMIDSFYKAVLNDTDGKPNYQIVANQTFLNHMDTILDRIMLQGVLFKADCFSCEQEYRLFINPFVYKEKLLGFEKSEDYPKLKPMDESIKKRFSCKNGLFISYIDLPYDRKNIREVTISPTITSPENKESLYKFLSAYDSEKIWNVNQSNIPIRF